MIERMVPIPATSIGADGVGYGARTLPGVVRADGRAERGGGEDRPAVRFVQIGPHARDVAHVVAHVVGDGGRIARVVFRDAGLDLADEVGADVRGLGVDAAADAREKRLRGGAHAEGDHGGGGVDQLVDRRAAGRHERHAQMDPAVGHVLGRDDDAVEQEIPEGDVEQAEADDRKAHDRAGAEGNLQAAVEAFRAALGRARRGVGGGLHPDEAAERRKEAGGQEGDRHEGVEHARKRHRSENGDEHDERDEHDLVLPEKVGERTFAHMARDLLHAVVPWRGLQHAEIEEDAGEKAQQRRERGDPPERGDGGIVFHATPPIVVRLNWRSL